MFGMVSQAAFSEATLIAMDSEPEPADAEAAAERHAGITGFDASQVSDPVVNTFASMLAEKLGKSTQEVLHAIEGMGPST